MRVTLGTTYYENPDNLRLFISNHIHHVDELFVVDDGSSLYPIEDFIDEIDYSNLTVYKVTKDYGFNSHGCRNLIGKMSKNDWIIFMDSDRVMNYPDDMMKNIKSRTNLKTNTRYRLIVTTNLHASVNDYFIHREHFFSAGGYDEELQGIRNGDRSFFRQLLAAGGKERVLYDCEIRFLRGPSTRKEASKNDRFMTKKEEDLLQQRESSPNPNKPILMFEWKKLK